MALRSDLGKVRGLGLAKSGTHHFITQRLTALALVLLVTFMVASLLSHVAGDSSTVTAWLRQPLVALVVGLFVITAFIHLRLGLQTVIEDYVLTTGSKLAALVAVNFCAVLGGGFGLLCVLKIALGN